MSHETCSPIGLLCSHSLAQPFCTATIRSVADPERQRDDGLPRSRNGARWRALFIVLKNGIIVFWPFSGPPNQGLYPGPTWVKAPYFHYSPALTVCSRELNSRIRPRFRQPAIHSITFRLKWFKMYWVCIVFIPKSKSVGVVQSMNMLIAFKNPHII